MMNQFKRKLFQIILLIFCILLTVILYSVSLLITKKPEPVIVHIETKENVIYDKIKVKCVSLKNSIIPLKLMVTSWIIEDRYVKNVQITIPVSSLSLIDSVKISIGSIFYTEFYYRNPELQKNWDIQSDPLNKLITFTSPAELNASSPLIKKFKKDLINLIIDKNTIYSNYRSFILILIMNGIIFFVLYYILFTVDFKKVTAHIKKIESFRKLKLFFLIAGLLSPFLFVFLNPYIQGDLILEYEWSKDWSKSPAQIYVNNMTNNYPFVGNIFTAGIMSFLDPFTHDENLTLHLYRFFIAIIDGIALYFLYRILLNLSIPNAEFWLFLIALLPSSWAGGAVWGQIDSVGQLFFLLAIYLFFLVYKRLQSHSFDTKTKLYYLSGILSLTALVLTKQLLIFGRNLLNNSNSI